MPSAPAGTAETGRERLARTVADLDGEDRIATAHLAEAIQYRSLDRTRRTAAMSR